MQGQGGPVGPGIPGSTQVGGASYTPVLKEIEIMSGHFLLLFLVLVCVYVSRIPESTLTLFRKHWIQALCFIAILIITTTYGYIHGILAALAFALVLSHASRSSFLEKEKEGFLNCPSLDATILQLDVGDNTTFIPKNHRWFGEKILGENPLFIREKGVSTSAVQDLSERTMGTGSSNVSR